MFLIVSQSVSIIMSPSVRSAAIATDRAFEGMAVSSRFTAVQAGRSGSLRSTDLQSPHLANDEAHALHHGCACSESTSVPLRPKARRRKRRALLSAECALIFFYFCQNSSVVCRGLFSCERTQTQERHPRRALCRNRRPEAKLPLLSVGK